jgi:hypothetical protein
VDQRPSARLILKCTRRVPHRGHLSASRVVLFTMNLECAMSSQRLTEYATAGDDDYPAHEHTYQMFLKLLRRAMMVIAGVLILMAIFLT